MMNTWTQSASGQSAESDSLFAEGVSFYRQGKYREALPYFTKVVELDKEQLPEKASCRAYGDEWAAACWHHLGNDKEARKMNDYEFEVEPVDRRETVFADSLYIAGFLKFKEENLQESISLVKKSCEALEEIVGKDHYALCDRLNFIAYMQLFNNDEAGMKATLERMQRIVQRYYSASNPVQVVPTLILIEFLLPKGRFEEAVQQTTTTLRMMDERKMQDTDEYIELLDKQTNALFLLGRISVYLESAKQLKSQTARHYGKSSERYGNLLWGLGNQFEQIKNEDCIDLFREAADVVKERLGERTENYLNLCVKVSTKAFKFQKYKVCKTYATKAEQLAMELTPDSIETILGCRMFIASADVMQNHNEQNKSAFRQVMEEIRTQLGEDHDLYLGARAALLVVNGLDNPSQLLSYLNEAQQVQDEIKRKNGSTGDLTSWRNDIQMSVLWCTDGQYQKGRQRGLAALDSIRTILDDPTAGWVAHSLIPELSKAAELYRTSFSYFQPDSVQYTLKLLQAECLRLKLEQEVRLDSMDSYNFKRDLRYYQETLSYTHDTLEIRSVIRKFADIARERHGEKSHIYENCLAALCKCYSDRSEELIPLLEERLGICQEILDKPLGRESYQTRNIRKALFIAKGDEQGLLAFLLEEDDYRSNYDLAKRLIDAGMYDKAEEFYRTELEESLKHKKKSRLRDNESTIGFLGEQIVEVYIKAGRSEEVPQLCAELIQRIRHARSRTWQYAMSQLFEFKDDQDSLREQSIQYCNEHVDFFREERSVQAILYCAKDRGYKYYSNFTKFQECMERFDKALALVEGHNERLYDELLLYKLFKQCDHYNSDNNCYMLETSAQEVINFFKNRPDKEQYKEYLSARTLQLKAKVEQFSDDPSLKEPLSQLCYELLPFVGKNLKSFRENGEIQRYYHYSWVTISESSYENLIVPLYAAATALGDSRLLAEAGSASVHKGLKELQATIVNPYYSFLQDKINETQTSATLLAFTTREDSIAALAYDASIFCKGALLRSEKLMENQILQSRNRTAIEQYQELGRTRQLLDAAHQNGLPADSLAKRIEFLTEQVRRDAQRFGDYSKAMVASWQDVRKRLTPQDVAIEFSTFLQNDTLRYCALVLHHNDEWPHLIPLCTEQELEAVVSPYESESLFRLVWAPLAEALQNVEKVYFSPAGRLHQLAIEYVPTPAGLFAECYRAFRLSNTREILNGRSAAAEQSSLLIGGVEYDPDAHSWEAAVSAHPSESTDNLLAMRDIDLFDTAKLRGSLMELEGTELEVERISELMGQNGLSATCLTGLDATEDAFKEYSGKGLTLLHIATHGFYLTATEAKGRELPLMTSERDSKEDQAMSRSGLLLAGAKTFLVERTAPSGLNDGILTARELARLDLTQVDLVVLSACETGLGDVTGDGVFGLQRGFKKAGVNSLVMSLWKVDDEATQLLMTKFYENLINNKMNKREAFIGAQHHLRTTDGGRFAKPQYWAAFILLDAVE